MELPEGVREIAFSAFHGCKRLESIVLPQSLSFIEGRAFAACDRLSRVFYKGSAEEFAEIAFEDRENAPFVAATKYFYSEEQPLAGNYWHYADGVPTEW